MFKYEHIIKHYITEGIISGSEYRCYCPFHHGTKQNFDINMETGFFHCWSDKCNEKR